MCVAPNTCACDIGWEGTRCEICLPLPGCKHGYCQNQAFECICQDENSWQGAHCDIRKQNTSTDYLLLKFQSTIVLKEASKILYQS